MPRQSLRIRTRKKTEHAESNEADFFVLEKTNNSSEEYSSDPVTASLNFNSATVHNHEESEGDSDSSEDLDLFAETFVGTLEKRLTDKQLLKSSLSTTKPKKTNELSSAIDVGDMNLESYISVNAPSEGNRKILDLYAGSEKYDPVMKHCVITPDFETKHEVPKELGKRALKKQRRAERNVTSGKKWFNMKAPELTEEVKRDMKILQMRSVLDPKRFYKKNDRKTIPKYFQIGKIMDNAADFYSSRVPMKQRKATLADELLADANFKRYQKRKFNEIQAKRRAMGGYRNFQTRRKGKRKTA